jgi:hypothetical protein
MPVIPITETLRILKEGKAAQIQVMEKGKWISKAHRVMEGNEHWPTVREELVSQLNR